MLYDGTVSINPKCILICQPWESIEKACDCRSFGTAGAGDFFFSSNSSRKVLLLKMPKLDDDDENDEKVQSRGEKHSIRDAKSLPCSKMEINSNLRSHLSFVACLK